MCPHRILISFCDFPTEVSRRPFIFCFLFDLLLSRLLAKKKHEIWEQKLWSERFLIYSRLRQMNIGVTFCSLRKYFLDLNRRKKLRERAEPVSPHKILAIFQTHAHSCAFRFFFFSDHALHVDLLSFIQDVEAAARWLRLRREGKYFSVDFWKAFGYSRKVAAANI